MSKKSRKPGDEPLPAAAEFATRHGIRLETARAILSAFQVRCALEEERRDDAVPVQLRFLQNR